MSARARLGAALLLALATALPYAQVRHHELIDWDDLVYVSENPLVRGGLTPGGVLAAFARPHEANWIPLTWISLQINHALHGTEPAGYLIGNALLHAASTAILFLALLRMTGAPGRSLFVAGVFGLHPLHVESVAWASERKDSLSGVFFMAALWAHARVAERATRGRRFLVAACMAAGLLAKPTVVTLPAVLLLLDGWPLGRLAGRVRQAVAEKVPLFALSALGALATLRAQHSAGAIDLALPLGTRLANAAVSTVTYVGQALWPAGLAAFYPHPGARLAGAEVAGACALLLLATAWALRDARRRPYLLVGWLWYLVTCLPVIGIVQVGQQAHADRYAYLPLVGLALAAAWLAVELVGTARARRAALAAAAALVLALLAAVTWFQVGTWRNTFTVFERALAVTEKNFLAQTVLASAYLREGRVAEAEARYAQALAWRPGWAGARLGLADVRVAQGRLAEGLEAYESFLREDPDSAAALGRYGLALVRAGRPAEAHAALGRALATHGASAELHTGMALAAAALRDPARAAAHGREAVRLRPDYVPAVNNLAWLLATCSDASLRDPEEALRLAARAVDALGGDDAGALDTLAAAQAAAGRYAAAARTAAGALRLAESRREDALAAEIRARKALYEAGRPYRE